MIVKVILLIKTICFVFKYLNHILKLVRIINERWSNGTKCTAGWAIISNDQISVVFSSMVAKAARYKAKRNLYIWQISL